MQLLVNVAGRDRVLTAPEASDRISTACDKLPLALRIASARLNTHPGAAGTMLAERLEDERGVAIHRCHGRTTARPAEDGY